MKRKLVTIAAFVGFFAAFGFVGAMDAEDAEQQAALYCDNVKSGVWPDYEGTYVSECEKTHGPKNSSKKFR